MIGSIQILEAVGGQYFFRVKATNGKILCHSETYHNWADCYAAAQIIQNGGGTIS